MNRAETIWLAGVFDCGGSAKAYSCGAGRGRNGTRWIFNIWITSAQAEVMDEVQRIIGAGSVYRRKDDDVIPRQKRAAFNTITKRQRPARSARYQAYANVARELAEAIRPFTRIRGDRIDAAFKDDRAHARKAARA